jgi:hypothetical protein
MHNRFNTYGTLVTGSVPASRAYPSAEKRKSHLRLKNADLPLVLIGWTTRLEIRRRIWGCWRLWGNKVRFGLAGSTKIEMSFHT